tara:strand:+ start:2735 stop:2980 length:246 start_codon:yes stop_codon:yes gene_type:complete
MYETRKELLRKIQDLFEDLNQCEVELNHQKESESDIERRLDRLEETVCSIISHIKEPITWLKNISEEIYEEAEAKRGDQDE